MRKLNLLLLEDDPDDADLIVETIGRAGLEIDVTVVCYRDEYTDAIKSNGYDLVLADNALPQFSAVEALEIAHEYHIEIPFILVTGSMSEEFAVDIMKLGAWDYILKDRLQRLPNAILSADSKRSLLREKQQFIDDTIKNEALMKEAEKMAHFGSWEMDMVNNTERWSDEQYRILGYSPGEVPAKMETYLTRVHPDDVALVKSYIDQAVAGKEQQEYGCRIIAGEAIKHIKAELVIRRDDSGKILRITGMNRDVTEKIVAEEKLQKSEANLRAIFDSADTGYVLLDTDFNILSFNKHVSEFVREQLGKEITEGTNVTAYFDSDVYFIVKGSLDSALNCVPVSYEMSYPQPNGFEKWYDVGYHPVWNKDGVVLGVLISQTDITAKKMLELQQEKITNDLIQRKNELEQFTYIVSHNLRAPVANILGITYILDKDYIHDEEQKALIAGMAASVEKLDGIITDLNQIIQLKQSISEKKEAVCFDKLVEDVKVSISNIINQNDVTVSYNFDEADCINTVKSFMHSIFFNLISNSIKYRRLGVAPVIEISSKRKGRNVELIFKDNGVGIDLEKKGNLLFGLYKRFHTDMAEGKGIGLFLVKTHVETLGGTIAVASNVNEGTEFTISLEMA